MDIQPSTMTMMADTGCSLNNLPERDFQAIYDYFFRDKFNCKKLKNTLMSCDCTDEQHKSIPDIQFTLNGYEMVIPRDMWFEKGGDKCVIKFMHSPYKTMWTLGLNFFNNYYTVFDYEQQRIGFAKSVNFGIVKSDSFM